jgi:beta-propeller uncharacterized protein DUF5122
MRWLALIAIALAATGASPIAAGEGRMSDNERRSGFLLLSRSSGRLVGDYPPLRNVTDLGEDIKPYVDAIVGDGSGGWFVGGWFTHVGDVPCPSLVHFVPGRPVTSASCTPTDGAVVLLRRFGPELFVGGTFTMIGGVQRKYVAQLDTATQSVTSWDPELTGVPEFDPEGGNLAHFVDALAVSGNVVYVGGDFDHAHGVSLSQGLVALDRETGQVVSGWRPPSFASQKSFEWITALAVAGPRLYVGTGSGVTTLALQTGRKLREFRVQNPPTFGAVINTIAVSSSAVYVGGNFLVRREGKVVRRSAIALDQATLRLTPWNPRFRPWTAGGLATEVGAISVAATTVYLTGLLYLPGTRADRAIAALDRRTGKVQPWPKEVVQADPTLVTALAVTASQVALGPGIPLGGS